MDKKIKIRILMNKGIVGALILVIKFLIAKLTKKPYALMIEPTSLCNLKCAICYTQHSPLKRTNNFMSFGMFKKIIDEVSYHCIYLNLWFAGEPLLNNELNDMIDYASNRNIITCISTNATKLDGSMCSKLINANLDRIIISFDGATKESYEKIRIGADFDKVLDNIRTLVRLKKEMKTEIPFISLQFVATKENEHEIPLFEKLAKDLGVDEAYVKSLYTFDAEDENIANKIKSLSPSETFQRKDINRLENCQARYRSVMLSDGTIIPCCFDVETRHNFGNINNSSFKSIWNSTAYRNFRKDKERFIKSPLCSSCGCVKDYILKEVKL